MPRLGYHPAMNTLRMLLLVVHISSAALLLGGGTGLIKSLRNVLDVGGAPLLGAATAGAKRGMLLFISAVVALLTGVALMFVVYGGFGPAPKNFHAALGVLLGAIVVSTTVMKPASLAILNEAKKPEPGRSVIELSLKKMAMGQGNVYALPASSVAISERDATTSSTN